MFRKCLAMLCVFLALFCAPGSAREQSEWLEVVFLDVGKADAAVLLTEHSVVVIDTGKNKTGEDLVDFLRSRGVSHIDVMIITHFDKDHVGGADKVLEAFSVGTVYECAWEKDSKQVRQYRDALESQGIQPVVLAEDVAFAIDGAQYAVDAAQHSYTGENASNDMSLVVRVEYGQTSFLFAADAENDRLFELLEEGDLASDVLKVPHHGGYEALSSAFFQAVSPEYAVITSDAEDPEDETVVHILSSLGATVYLTRLGSVTMVSDGENLDVSQAAFSEQ